MANEPSSHVSGMTFAMWAARGAPAFAANQRRPATNCTRSSVVSLPSASRESASRRRPWTCTTGGAPSAADAVRSTTFAARLAPMLAPVDAESSLTRDVFRLRQLEPHEVVRTECQQIRQLANSRERAVAPQLDRHAALELPQVELDVLCEARQVVDAEDRLLLEAAEEHEHTTVVGVERLPRAASKRLELSANRDQPAHPPQKRRSRPLLCRDVHSLIAVRCVD